LERPQKAWAENNAWLHVVLIAVDLVLSLTGFHPDVAFIQRCLTALGEELDIQERPEPGLHAVLVTPAGEVDLQ
jgi:hypothetical protein